MRIWPESAGITPTPIRPYGRSMSQFSRKWSKNNDRNVVKRTAERNTERNTVTLLRCNMLRSASRSRLRCHSHGLESVNNSSDADKTKELAIGTLPAIPQFVGRNETWPSAETDSGRPDPGNRQSERGGTPGAQRDDERPLAHRVERPEGLLGCQERNTMANYSVDDQHSNQITTGLSERNARSVAQRIANERGETVYLYADEPQSATVAVEPTE